MRKLFFSFITTLLFLFISPLSYAADPLDAIIENPLVIEGFYLGMTQEDALANVSNYKNEGWKGGYANSARYNSLFEGHYSEIYSIGREYSPWGDRGNKCWASVTASYASDGAGASDICYNLFYLNNYVCAADFKRLYNGFNAKYGKVEIRKSKTENLLQFLAKWTLPDGSQIIVHAFGSNYRYNRKKYSGEPRIIVHHGASWLHYLDAFTDFD